MPMSTVAAPTVAVPPTFISFLTLKSSPRLKSRKMTPISPHVSMLETSRTVGSTLTAGPASTPANR